MKNNKCKSLVIEGIDRLGKSLQTNLLINHLRSSGFRVRLIKSPYNEGFTYPVIYWMLRTGWARRVPNVFQLVQFVNKIWFQTFSLPRLLRENDFIIFDRWNISMWAYGLPDGANRPLTEWLLRFISEPDFTIILDGVPHITENGDSYESDPKYQNKVRSLYLNWVVAHPCCVGRVNANQPVQDVFDDILQYLQNHSGLLR